jgi:hypothetical protein
MTISPLPTQNKVPRFMLASIWFIAAGLYFAIGARWLTSFAWPYGRLVTVSEGTPSDFVVGMLTLGLAAVYGIIVTLIALSPRLTRNAQMVFLLPLIITPPLVCIWIGIGCDIEGTRFGMISCTGNKTRLILDLGMFGTSLITAILASLMTFAIAGFQIRRS